MNDPTSFRTLIEKVAAESEVYRIQLPVPDTKLSPVLSKESVDLHYGTLYNNYVKNALDGQGEFQVAGAKLHTLFFEQFQSPITPNIPRGAVAQLIDSNFSKGMVDLKEAITEAALKIQGSGWVYLSKNGKIKTIENHSIRTDILVLIDMWEHAYIHDYKADKKEYLKNIWKIINWDIINMRLN